MSQAGKLYAIGVGPGDPDLLTIKAVNVLVSVSVVAVPISAAGKKSMALSIASKYIRPDAEILTLPFAMVKDQNLRQQKRRQAADQIVQRLQTGQDVAFLSEGDVMVYSTFGYVLNLLAGQYTVEIIPGISSVMASAAQAQLPLVFNHQHLAVLPATHIHVNDLKRILNNFDTLVLLKVSSVMEILVPILRDAGRLQQAVIVEFASMENSRVIHDFEHLKNGELSYMSQMIVTSNKPGDIRAD